MLVLNCAETHAPYNLSAHVTLQNPNGEHLVCGTLPFPTMYTYLIALWVILGVWSLEKILRKVRRTTLVSLGLILMVALKVAYCVLSMEWWKEISRVGTTPSFGLKMGRVVTNAVFEFLFFGSLMVLATGWSVLRRNFTTKSKITIGTLFYLFGNNLII